MCNYIIGYDVINSIFEGPKRHGFFAEMSAHCNHEDHEELHTSQCRYKEVTKAFTQCGNLMPSWEVQEKRLTKGVLICE